MLSHLVLTLLHSTRFFSIGGVKRSIVMMSTQDKIVAQSARMLDNARANDGSQRSPSEFCIVLIIAVFNARRTVIRLSALSTQNLAKQQTGRAQRVVLNIRA